VIEIDLNRGGLAAQWRIDPCGVLYELAALHPGAPARLRLGDQTLLLFQDSLAAEHVAHASVNSYRKHFGGFRQFFGDSRITRDGERWRASRARSQPAIAAAKPLEVAEVTRRIFTDTAGALLAKNSITLLDEHLDHAAGRVIAQVMLGFEPDEISATLAQDFRVLLRHASMTTWNVSGAVQLHDPVLRDDFDRTRLRLRDGLTAAVRRHTSTGTLPVLLDRLMAASDDLDSFAEVCALLFAGFDTTAAALGWALWLLAGAGSLQDRLRDEVSTRLTPRSAAAELLACDELNAFIAEALRIFPPIPILSRIATEADRIGDVPVNSGQKVLVSVIGLHHDRRWFPDPRKVSLARFPRGELPAELRGHYLPFGLGQRACPGGRIASAELSAALATLLHAARFERLSDAPLAFEWLASLRRAGGQHLKVRPTGGAMSCA
jgi:cytochrome P450